MANTLGEQMTLLAAGTILAPGFAGGTVRVFNEEVTLAGQAIADTIEVASLPKGAIPLCGVIVTDTAFGATATVAVGVSGTAGKYRAAAILNVTTPEVFGVAGGVGEALTADETVFLTVAAAALPGSGTLRVMIFYAFD